ncbi:MAG: hypothetical protein DPW09_05450 [Anaerolineae bacterium]|nr:hypothetical protein [Anaerolineales bacterium]MCQ3972880.1 hypothetical protein [Anaerolineae bacterium]
MNLKPIPFKGLAVTNPQAGIALSRFDFLLGLWVIWRLPLLLALLYFFAPDEFIWLATITAIHLVGTLPERLVFFLVIALALGGCFVLAQRLPARRWRFLLPFVFAFGLFWGLFQLVPGLPPLIAALLLTGVLAINTISTPELVNFMSNKPGRLIANFIFGFAVGLSELLLLKPLVLWLFQFQRTSKFFKTFEVFTGYVLVPGLAALLLDPYSLSDFHRTLWPDPAVQLLARENYSWTELDVERRVLYASGYGTNYLHAFDLDKPDQPPRLSPVENGYAQGFAYNPVEQEIYLYNVLTHHLLTLDAVSLELKKSVAAPPLSPGDVWVAWDSFSDSLVIASEADEQEGVPTIIIDRPTGQLRAELNLDPGNIALHPSRPWLYMSFLRRVNELVVYDLEQQRIIKRVSVPERLDRLIFAPGEQGVELFASAPLNSTVLRFDAETLERKDSLKTLFGGRAIAVDASRNWLLCGSLVTHQLEVIDLTTGQRVAAYYLGPWLRTIVLDSRAGVAYVSSHGGLFVVHYAD